MGHTLHVGKLLLRQLVIPAHTHWAGMTNSSPPESPPGTLTPSPWREIRNEIRVCGYFRKTPSLWKLEEPGRSALMFSLVLRIKWDSAHSVCPTHGECSVHISYYYDVLLTVIIKISRNLVIYKIHIKCQLVAIERSEPHCIFKF